MRKLLLTVLLLLALGFTVENYQPQYAINIIQHQRKLALQSHPVMVAGILYVPLREIAEALNLEWANEPARNSYVITRASDSRSVRFKLNSAKIQVNDQPDELASPILEIKHTFYAPLNDFLWTLGYFVEQKDNNYFVETKIKDLNWKDQVLKVQGQAPLQARLQKSANGYDLIIEDCILEMEPKDLLVEDGSIKRIYLEQTGLTPAKVAVHIETDKVLNYNAFQEDENNSFALAFDYQPIAIAEQPLVASVVPLSEPAAQPEPARVSQKILFTTGTYPYPSRNILWLPEETISVQNKITMVLKGIKYSNIPIKYLNKQLYVKFNDVFAPLGLTLPVGRSQDVPLVETLRSVGYAAYYTQGVVYINPRITELTYVQTGDQRQVLIKSNDRIYPQPIQYLTNPVRAVIDIPQAAYDAPLNYLRIHDGQISMVRAAQFDKGIVRVVIDLSSSKKPVMTYAEQGRLITLVFDRAVPGPDEIIRMATLPIQIKPKTEEKIILPEQIKIENTKTNPLTQLTQTKPADLKGLRVAIIPGHGGTDVGAISRSGYMEKYPTLEVAKKLQYLLSQAGATPLMCREDDQNVSLDDQAEFANRNRADLLVSVHFNSFLVGSVHGAETYYYKPIDKEFAGYIHEEITKLPGIKNKGLKKAQMHNLNHTTMPGVLIEPLFISNRQEEALIRDQDFQWKLAKALFIGIEKYQRNKAI